MFRVIQEKIIFYKALPISCRYSDYCAQLFLAIKYVFHYIIITNYVIPLVTATKYNILNTFILFPEVTTNIKIICV